LMIAGPPASGPIPDKGTDKGVDKDGRM